MTVPAAGRAAPLPETVFNPGTDERSALMRFSTSTLRRDERGITGLETAIILISFVVVASIFAFTILSSGVYASERTKQSVFSGLQDTRSSIAPKGAARGYRGYVGSTEAVYQVSFTVANAVDGEAVDLTPPYTTDGSGTDPDLSVGAEYVTVLSYWDENQYLPDIPWTVNFIGFNNGDNLLEVGEAAEITAWLLDRNTAVSAATSSSVSYMDGTVNGGGTGGITVTDTLLVKNRKFRIEMKPPRGAIVSVERKTPPSLRTVMDLR
jgi:flagellin FlaB